MSSSHELEKRQTQTENLDIWVDPPQLKTGGDNIALFQKALNRKMQTMISKDR